jgi:hypothetical protein
VTVFVVPPLDGEPWPTLGQQVCDLIEERAVFGPGSLKGQQARLDAETRALFYKAYELYPQGSPYAGRRRFRRVRFSMRKGTAKTEKLGWIAFAELHPEAPVRFDGWDAYGNPVGRPVNDPYIPLLAYTAEQVEELAYNVLYVVCTEGPDADLFDSGLERIVRLDARGRRDGIAVPLAQSPNARDGARTTFQGYDETHRLDLPRNVEAYETMEANLPKRPLDDPWSMGITTAGVPGGGSVAERDKDEADAIARGEIDEPELLYFHREAGPGHDLSTLEGRIEAIREASGPAAEWSDLRGIAKQWDRPSADLSYLERVWLNRWTQAAAQAFDPKRWREQLADVGRRIPDGAQVTGGFDGSRWRDTTALVITEVDTGFQRLAGLWVPEDCPGGEVPVAEVEAAMDDAFRRWRMLRLYGDPAQGWDDPLARLAGKHGAKKVALFYTDSRNLRRTATMCRSYAAAIKTGEVRNDGDPRFARHVGAAQKRDIHMQDEDGTPLWVMSKERHDSPNKIDAAMAGGLSWQARLDALASGDYKVPQPKRKIIVMR